jgi:hypothetical protein
MELTHKFGRNKKYYTGEVYEFNLPTGWSCPHAVECLVKVDKETGKFNNTSDAYKCYASTAERFPAVREMRWNNFEYVKKGNKPVITDKMTAVRIHAAGDFFSQKYFDMWLEIAKENPQTEFWAYTKSIQFWVNRIDDIPDNLMLTASYGSSEDSLIEKYNLKYTKVIDPNLVKFVTHEEYPNDIPKDSIYEWVKYPGTDEIYPVDTNDDWSRINITDSKGRNFILLDNNIKRKPNASTNMDDF